MTGKLIVLTGLPASGKDSLINKLLEKHTDIKRIVTYTDRPMRIGEIHKSDYHFVSTNKFHSLISKDFFLEYVKTGSFYKGTSKSSFKPVLNGKNIIWRIDMIRAVTIEETFIKNLGNAKANEILSRTMHIHIQAGSYNEALDRFINRNQTSHVDEFYSRYKVEMKIFEKNLSKFPIIIKNLNGKLNEALQELEKSINLATS